MFKRFSIISIFILASATAHAISIIAGPTLTGSPVTSETGLSTGVTVQFTLDTAGQVQIVFSRVNSDSSLSQVALITQNAPTGASSIFWPALWLIGTDFGRHNGTYVYQVTPSTNSTVGTALPATGDASAVFTIASVDIHNLIVTPSLDASQQPTFPYTISYALSQNSRVTATITNSSGTVVRTLISNQIQAGENVTPSSTTLSWNGLGNDGKPAPLGTYTLTVNATDINGANPAITRTKSLDVLSLAGAASDPQKLFEDNVFVYPNPVRNGQGIFQMEAIRDGANLSLKIYTISGTLVREESFAGIAAGNINTFTWDATNQSGNKVGRGLYYYVVRETDSAGTLQTVKKMAVLP